MQVFMMRSFNNCTTNQVAGPDGLLNVFERIALLVCLNPLHTFIVRNFETNYFPAAWKVFYISPIHKNTDKSCVSNIDLYVFNPQIGR